MKTSRTEQACATFIARSMGCGSSKPERLLQQEEEGNESGAAAREEESARFATISALTSHLSGALGLPAAHPDVKRYASTLDSEGWDTPDAFDDLTIENLKEAPFNFKPGHLKRVRVVPVCMLACQQRKRRLHQTLLSCTLCNDNCSPPFTPPSIMHHPQLGGPILGAEDSTGAQRRTRRA